MVEEKEMFPYQKGKFSVMGLPYMMSGVGGGRGVPKKQMRGTKSADL